MIFFTFGQETHGNEDDDQAPARARGKKKSPGEREKRALKGPTRLIKRKHAFKWKKKDASPTKRSFREA